MLDAGQDVLLSQVAGINQQESEFLVGLIAGVTFDEFRLFRANLARFSEHAQ